MNKFNIIRDQILSDIEAGKEQQFSYPLKRIGSILGAYPKKEFLGIGGRKTAGKGYFMLNNYVIAPILQELRASKIDETLGLNLIYVNNKKTYRSTIERMVVNFTSNINKGSKIGIPSLYEPMTRINRRYPKEKSKQLILEAVSRFSKLEDDKKIHLLSNRHSVESLRDTIYSIMEETGSFNGDYTEFTYSKKKGIRNTIIVIDDASGITGSEGKAALRNADAVELAMALKEISRMFDCLVVLGIPSANDFYKDTMYKGYVSALSPYGIYTDRLAIMHNPLETSDVTPMGYTLDDFINPKTGISYFRFMNILANHSGPSNVAIPLFMFPENGYFIELPSVESPKIDTFYGVVLK